MRVEARDTRELTRLHRRMTRVDLLILDELGFVPFDRTGGELLFTLVAERYERRSVLVTSNLAFSEWPNVFGGDEKLTTVRIPAMPIAHSGRCRSPVPAKAITPGVDAAG